MLFSSKRAFTLIATVSLVGPLHAQIFVRNSTQVPGQGGSSARYTENIDFGDIDLDGDFDAAHSRGGDLGNLQDRIWINRGGIQGGVIGVFNDQTSSRMPAIARDGRDVEFVDIDNDGDLDMYSSNTSTNSNQGNLWFENDGGLQGGSLGFYSVRNRFVGLGGPGSSIAPALVSQGTFIDWSCDCDFGDLDNDGDMDLVHSTYGGNFSGQVPTRIFLNDGAGFYSEFNPSGFKILGTTILNGDPGLWCEGTQQSNTANTNGSFCDIATNTLDIDLGDVDGDFDLDILHGDRSSVTRFFYNRLEENGGTPGDLAFRDMTNFVYPSSWSDGEGHYEQELGDFDGDNDLDLYGLNWRSGGFAFDDNVFENVNGQFTNQTILGGSGSDDNEGDWGDYDNDGDLDLYVANFQGTDRLYRNDGSGNMTLLSDGASGLSSHGLSGYSSLDADWCDVDEDGDYDVFSAQDTNKPVVYWQNQTNVADTTPPRVAPVETLGNFTATITTSPDRAVRAHVYDNAPYYVTWYNPTKLHIYRNGELVETRDALSSGGQVFRGEIPSNLVGTIEYEFVSEDQYGNSTTSVRQSYTADPGGLTVDIPYGTADNGDFAGEMTLESGSLLTPGKNWHIRIDTNTGQGAWFYLLAISLAPSTPTPDPVLGVVNIDVNQVVLGILGDVDASEREYVVLPIASDVSVPAAYIQAYRPNLAFMDWSASKGLEIPLHE